MQVGDRSTQTLVARREIVAKSIQRLVDFAARGARRLLQARFQAIDCAVAILDLLADQLGRLLELVVDALVDLGETLVLRIPRAGDQPPGAGSFLEAALIAAHLSAEQDVADLVDTVIAGTIRTGLLGICHGFAGALVHAALCKSRTHSGLRLAPADNRAGKSQRAASHFLR